MLEPCCSFHRLDAIEWNNVLKAQCPSANKTKTFLKMSRLKIVEISN